MKTKLPLLSILTFLVLFTSCKERLSEIELDDPLVRLMNLEDSCSYQLNGQLCVFDSKIFLVGNGSSQVNIDAITDKGHPDSIMYWREYRMENKSFERFTIRLVKKYYIKEKTTYNIFTFKPQNEYEVFTAGNHPYAVDFTRYNTQNGVAIDIISNVSSEFKNLQSYFPGSRLATTIGYDCQENANFEITKIQKLPNGKHFLEAKFSANVFSFKRKITSNNNVVEEATGSRIENGYIRFQY